MKKILFFAVLLMVCSCSKPAKLLLYNNTQSVINVIDGEKKVSIPASSSRKIKYPINGKFAVEYKDTLWTYTVDRFPPKEYCTPVAAATIYAQIEADGAIYVFFPKSDLPSSDLNSQPEGFPLMPL